MQRNEISSRNYDRKCSQTVEGILVAEIRDREEVHPGSLAQMIRKMIYFRSISEHVSSFNTRMSLVEPRMRDDIKYGCGDAAGRVRESRD